MSAEDRGIEAALNLLGLPPGIKPTEEHVMLQYRGLLKAHHPDTSHRSSGIDFDLLRQAKGILIENLRNGYEVNWAGERETYDAESEDTFDFNSATPEEDSDTFEERFEYENPWHAAGATAEGMHNEHTSGFAANNRSEEERYPKTTEVGEFWTEDWTAGFKKVMGVWVTLAILAAFSNAYFPLPQIVARSDFYMIFIWTGIMVGFGWFFAKWGISGVMLVGLAYALVKEVVP